MRMCDEADPHEELLDAARYGELEEVQELLKSGVNVNFQDAGGNTGMYHMHATTNCW